MAKTLNVNYSDSSGGTAHSITIPSVNFGVDFRNIQIGKNNEGVISNITSPVGLPERFRFAANNIKDIYAGTSVDKAMYALSRQGTSFLVQLTDTYTLTDESDPSYTVALPMEAHLVVKVPQNEAITDEVVMTFVGRMLAGLFETSDGSAKRRINALLHHSILPKDL